MRELVLQISTLSLDGFVAEENTEAAALGDVHDAELEQYMVDSILEAGVHIMGSVTYESMARHWPTSTEVFAAPMNDIPKVVFSKSLQLASWTVSTIAAGDTTEEVARLKRQSGGLVMAHGGVTFAQSLVELDVVDEYRLFTHPYVAGHGRSLFGGVAQPRGLRLVSSRSFSSGVLALYYRRVKSPAT